MAEDKPGAVQKFLMPYVDRILDRVMPPLMAKVDELKTAALAELEAQIPVLMNKLLALLPVLAATVGKEVTDKVVETFANVLKIDPDIPGLSNVFDLSETIRHALNADTPDEIHFPSIQDVLKGLRGR